MTAAEYLALACPHHTTRPPARVDCQLCFFDAATELLALRAERDSLKLRVQQLEADEDRLDWCEENAIAIDNETRQIGSGNWYLRASDAIGYGLTLRDAIDRARAKP